MSSERSELEKFKPQEYGIYHYARAEFSDEGLEAIDALFEKYGVDNDDYIYEVHKSTVLLPPAFAEKADPYELLDEDNPLYDFCEVSEGDCGYLRIGDERLSVFAKKHGIPDKELKDTIREGFEGSSYTPTSAVYIEKPKGDTDSDD